MADIKQIRCFLALALQLRIFSISESIGFDDSEVMDDRCINRDDAGILGIFAA